MELVVRKNDLLRELQLFQGIVERKNTIPILANVLMEAKGDQVSFLATDLEVGLRSRCAAAVAKGGSLTLPAKKFYEIVKSLPETDIRIAEDKGGVKVAAERFDSRMQTLPREDFPTLPEASRTPTATLSRASLKEMVGEDAVRHHGRGHTIFPERRVVHPSPGQHEPGRDRWASPRARDDASRQQRRAKTKPTSKRFSRRRPSVSSRAFSLRATKTSATSAVKTTCSSMSAAGCSSHA